MNSGGLSLSAGACPRVAVGILLLGTGLALGAGASRLARSGAAAPFACGLTVFAPPRPATVEPDPPPSSAAPARPIDLASLYGTFRAEDRQALAGALDGLRGSGWLDLHIRSALLPAPRHVADWPQGVMLAVVDDGQADRALDPLVPAVERGAQVYLGTDLALARLVAGYDFPPAAAGSSASRLPDSARCLRGMALVRVSAAERFAIAAGDAACNATVVELTRPGDMEEAMRRLWPLWQARGLSARPVDLALGTGSLPRWLGTAALAMILAGGSLLMMTGLVAAGRTTPGRNPVLAYLVGSARVLDENRRDYGAVLAAMMAVLVVGAAWGGPAGLGDLAREIAGEPLARIGLTAVPVGWTGALDLFTTALLVNVLLAAMVGIALPGMVPGLGVVAAGIQFAAWGVLLAPTTLTALDRLPLRAVVATVEGHAYALLAFGAWRVLLGLARPGALGQKRRREGYAAGLADLYRLLAPAAVILLAAALLETALVAILSRAG